MAFKDLTQGSVPKQLIQMALPFFGSFVLQSLYSLADLYFVGLLGGAPLAGLGIALNTFFLVLALGQIIGVGTLSILSQSYGRKDFDRVTQIFRQSFLLIFLLGSVAWVIGYFSADGYFDLFTKDPEVHGEGVIYFRIYCATFLFQLFLMVNGYAWRALGDFITPTILMVVSVVINLLLDPLLIFGFGPVPAYGIAGAAWATVISQAVAGLVYLWLILKGKKNRLLSIRTFPRIEWAVWARLFRIGMPSGLQFLLFSVISLMMFRFIMPFGVGGSAGVAVGFRILHSAILPGVAVCSAVASMVGQNYGARNYQRVKSAVLWGTGMTFILMSLEYGFILISPSFWVGLFSTEPHIIEIGSEYLIVTGAVLPFQSLGLVAMFTLQGVGRTLMPFISIIVRFLCFLSLVLLLQAYSLLNARGIFISGIVGTTMEILVLTGALTYFWHRVLNKPPAAKGLRPLDSRPL